MYHRFKAVKNMTEGEISRREKQLEDEHNAEIRAYLSAKSVFEEQFFATMGAETKNMLEDEWRMLAMEKEWIVITAASKADLEVYYPRDGSMYELSEHIGIADRLIYPTQRVLHAENPLSAGYRSALVCLSLTAM